VFASFFSFGVYLSLFAGKLMKSDNIEICFMALVQEFLSNILDQGKILDGSGKSNPVVALVKFGVVLADEDIAKDPQGTVRRWNVNAHESR
jgi:hypothetical protein